VLKLPPRTPVGVSGKADPCGLRCLDEEPQRTCDLAFEIMVGLQALIDHRAFERVVVDRDDRGRRRLAAGWIPRRLATNEENQVGIAEE
jgi:hypothetical protein